MRNKAQLATKENLTLKAKVKELEREASSWKKSSQEAHGKEEDMRNERDAMLLTKSSVESKLEEVSYLLMRLGFQSSHANSFPCCQAAHEISKLKLQIERQAEATSYAKGHGVKVMEAEREILLKRFEEISRHMESKNSSLAQDARRKLKELKRELGLVKK